MRASILAAFVLGLAPAAPAGEEAAEIYRFEVDEPAHAASGLVARVVIRCNLACDVTFVGGATSSDVKLTEEDLEALARLLSEANLREDPLPPTRSRNEEGPAHFTGALRLFRAGSPIVSAVVPWGRTAGVARWLERLATEAAFLRVLHDDGNPSLPRAGDVLHAPVRREALERALATRRQPDTVVVALAQVVPCAEWVRALGERLRCGDRQREDSLACALAWTDPEGLPKQHREARVRLLVGILERERGARGVAASSVANALCRARYLPALPLIVRVIEEEEAGWDVSLHEFGVDALDPLWWLLESPDPHVRWGAVSNVASLADGLDRLPEDERKAILRRLHVEFTLKVREIARHDPDGTAQAVAWHALRAIAWAVGGEEAAPEVFSFDGERTCDALRIRVRSDGTCEARFYDGVVSSDVKLRPEDLETFERLASDARLLESPPQCPQSCGFVIGGGPGDTFGGTLRLDGSESWISMRDRTAETARWLDRLMTEVRFLRAVQDQEPRSIPSDPEALLHPSVLRDFLERALVDWEHPATIVERFARVTSCEEWTRAIENRLRSGDEERRDELVLALVSCGGLPTEHRKARVGLLLDALQREYSSGAFDMRRGEAAWRVADALCRERCRAAMPIVVGMIERAGEIPYPVALEEFGADALDPLAKLLESPNPFARRFAVRSVRSLAQGIGGCPDILPRLRQEFTLKIREIARHDPDGTAQALAGHALVDIARAAFGE
ncbi:MAG TPA: hypothetical protein VFY93_15120 [Planctomycetota bacterium]|nr:hypothetical protein [Planctomycetota bacterium]